MAGKVNDQWLKDVCKFVQKEATCAFLAMGPDGFKCAKGNPALEDVIRARLAEGTMKAQSDNCDGI